jgi:hypothetical protein
MLDLHDVLGIEHRALCGAIRPRAHPDLDAGRDLQATVARNLYRPRAGAPQRSADFEPAQKRKNAGLMLRRVPLGGSKFANRSCKAKLHRLCCGKPKVSHLNLISESSCPMGAQGFPKMRFHGGLKARGSAFLISKLIFAAPSQGPRLWPCNRGKPRVRELDPDSSDDVGSFGAVTAN